VWPTDLSGWSTLAEIYRRMGARAAADDALRHAQYLCPDWASSFSARAQLAYESGEKESAIALWKSALALNPEDEKLANRLDFLAPESRAPWADDVPTDEQIEKVVGSRGSVKPLPGADVAYLLDHEVTQLASDGSTQNVVTLVLHAFNAAGRDRLTRQQVNGGRLRMLHAYAVDPNGTRTEASSERAGSVFFRNLQIGSTVVLQYRNDEPAKGYLSRHLTKSWSFQGLSDQRVRAEFVLWTPLSTKLHETTIGPVKREEVKKGDQLRIDWYLLESSPLVYEPSMPTVQELAANIRISTVPDWETWVSWEKALLVGAFRTSPEVDAVAERLAAGAKDPLERAERVHEFVMEEIRYQQDYESFIAGVKPHAAPMVLERKYGDCKDKAVLFITLAKKLGLEAHFALVRTRDVGPIDGDVPMQQFNHAIVYLPQQAGFPEGRFFDPTADALDLDAVRSDDTGTRSLVFDPNNGVHTWREIPFQSYALNSEQWKLELKLEKDGAGSGALVVAATGRTGSLLRRTARNLEQASQLMQRQAQRLIPGASSSELGLDQVKDLRSPAQLSAKVASKTLARVEGGDLRLKLPSDFAVRGLFALSTRRHPLVLGAPSQSVTQVTLEVPEGYAVSRAPADAEVKAACMTFSRKLQVNGSKVVAELRGRFLCERIGADEYSAYRAQAEDMSRLLDEELVMSPVKPVKLGPKAAQR
jgi:transglutaminase-like putative cysteine protease